MNTGLLMVFTGDGKGKTTAALEGWHLAVTAMTSGGYHLVVLDEFTYPLQLGMIDMKSAMKPKFGWIK